MDVLGTITAISGPVIRVRIDFKVHLFEVVHTGHEGLLGEVVRIRGSEVDVQVYEDTSGLMVGDPVRFSGKLLAVDLGPGLLGNILDGIGRPLTKMAESGIFLARGEDISALDRDSRWPFSPRLAVGDVLSGGDVIGETLEGRSIRHLVSVPPDENSGTVEWIAEEGHYALSEPVCRLADGREFFLFQKWEVRRPRPVKGRLPFDRPLLTGQRILDSLFPVALGGAAVVPGGFGTGKTVTQQSLAKWCNADVIIYIGCGERGNEMTEVLEEFPELVDPRTGNPLMDRMVLIANTSNMPVAAREASIYLGMTIGEFYRDMGYHVAIMADSTSRWAEALREIGGRLEEMPGEEGYPAYLGSRLAQYYERAGRVEAKGEPAREGSITVVSAVSPAGGDFSEPVTQASLRLSGTFWALDKRLAQQRHFPAINWDQSYTLYAGSLAPYFRDALGDQWEELRHFVRQILEQEKVLNDLVQLVGRDGLSEKDKWVMTMAELVRVVFLQQNAFDDKDAFTSPEKQKELLKLLSELNDLVLERIDEGLIFEQVQGIPLRAELLELRLLTEEQIADRSAFFLRTLAERLSSMEVIG
jgi:V/A-type H+-transporting ATPase subunit A